MKEMKVRVTFTEEVLGTASSKPDIHSEYIASKAPDAPTKEQEVAALGAEEVIENDMTIFPKDENGNPIFWDYQIRGYFKEACSFLKKMDIDTKSKKLKAHKKEVDGLVMIAERKIPIHLNLGKVGNCQRSLRAQTAQGERIALANSETVPAGSYIDFTVQCLNGKDLDLVKEWLDYGVFHGMGQWRNSGKGKFLWDKISERELDFQEAVEAAKRLETQKLNNEMRLLAEKAKKAEKAEATA